MPANTLNAATPPAPSFFEPGCTYRYHHFAFRCDTITTHPGTGERLALGWFGCSDGSWKESSSTEAEWAEGAWIAQDPPAPAGRDGRDVHTWFGLSYSTYLVLHRTLLQSMPSTWQHRLVGCLEELQDAFAHVPQPEAWKVEAATEHLVNEMTDAELAQAGITADWYRGEQPPKDLPADELAEWRAQHEADEPTYHRDGQEIDPGERILLPAEDPVPHYNRGRTLLTPAT